MTMLHPLWFRFIRVRLGCLLAFVESGIADLAESFQVADQGPDITSGDIVRRAVETLGAQGSEPRQNGVDLGLPGDEGGQASLLSAGQRIKVAPVDSRTDRGRARIAGRSNARSVGCWRTTASGHLRSLRLHHLPAAA